MFRFSFFAAGLMAIVAALLAERSSAQDATTIITFEPPVLATVLAPFRVTFYGSNISEGAGFRLARNSTDCNEGSNFAEFAVPDGTISNVVYWNEHDPNPFFVAAFLATEEGRHVRACYTRNNGQTWRAARNQRGRAHLRVWHMPPVIEGLAPRTPTAGQPLFLFLYGLPDIAYGALTTSESGCDGVTVDHVLPGANRSVYNQHHTDKGFVFHPTAAASRVWLCVASSHEEQDWSLVPFDPDAVVTRRTHPQLELPSGVLPLYRGSFEVFSSAARHFTLDLSCTMFAAGMTVLCQMRVSNTTALALAASDLRLSSLTDGGGVFECPLPTVEVDGVDNTLAYFYWSPQRPGRGGSVSFLYKESPIAINDNDANRAVYDFGNSTTKAVPPRDRSFATSRFIVQQGFSELHTYAAASLIDFSALNPTAGWDFSMGVPSANGDQAGYGGKLSATLADGTSTGTLSVTQAVPSDATMCLVQVRYYYSAIDGADFSAAGPLGAVSVQLGSNPVVTNTLYAHGQRVGAVNDNRRRQSYDGDMRGWEAVNVEVPILASGLNVQVVLSADHTTFRRLYFQELTMRCSNTVHTPVDEVAALQRIYNDVGTSSTLLADWRLDGAFRGDPCTNHWDGVTCRNHRVVALHLRHAELSGTFPSIPELYLLESIDLSFNSLIGPITTEFGNLSALVHADLRHNLFTELGAGAFTAASQACLQTLRLRSNQIETFPTQTQTLPALKLLDLAHNSLQGSVGNWDPEASQLVQIDVSHNHLSGSLPPVLPFHTARTIDFGSNQFTGSIPPAWGMLRRAEMLDVSKNDLSGAIPHELARIRSAGQLTLNAEENFFTGLLPSLGLRRTNVRDNIFRCPLPKDEPFVLTSHYGGMTLMECDYNQV